MTLGPIFLCCDESYAAPLATALRSLTESNSVHWPLDIRVLVNGASGYWTKKVEASLPVGSAAIRWHNVDMAQYKKFPTMKHVSLSTFGRLFIQDFVSDTEKHQIVLYLDTDILIIDDISQLFKHSLLDCTLGAVRDKYDAERHVLSASLKSIKYGPKVSKYFNAGVLLIDLKKWKQRDVSQISVQYLLDNPRTPYADQDALNIACDQSWMELETKWNFIQFENHTDLARTSPERRPAIVHFAGWAKPWNYACPSPNAVFYDQIRSRTLFRRSRIERTLDWGRQIWGPRLRTITDTANKARAALRTILLSIQKA